MNATCFLTQESHTRICESLKKAQIKFKILKSDGNDKWIKLKIVFSANSIVLNSLHRYGPGTDLSRLILSTHNYANKKEIESIDADNKKITMKIIENCRMAIGLVFDDGIKNEDFRDFLLILMEKEDGVIFDGNYFYDGNFNVLV